MDSKEKINKAYIDSKLQVVFEPMVQSIVEKEPSDVVRFKFSQKKARFHDYLHLRAFWKQTSKYI